MVGNILTKRDNFLNSHLSKIKEYMEEKIKQELKAFSLTIDDLTPQELEELKSEIKAKDEGKIIVDGVLSNPEIMYRKRLKNG